MAKILQFPEPTIPELVDHLLELRRKRREQRLAEKSSEVVSEKSDPSLFQGALDLLRLCAEEDD